MRGCTHGQSSCNRSELTKSETEVAMRVLQELRIWSLYTAGYNMRTRTGKKSDRLGNDEVVMLCTQMSMRRICLFVAEIGHFLEALNFGMATCHSNPIQGEVWGRGSREIQMETGIVAGVYGHQKQEMAACYRRNGSRHLAKTWPMCYANESEFPICLEYSGQASRS